MLIRPQNCPASPVTCEAEIEVVGAAGRRTLLANEFFSGPLMKELHSDEIITELRLPPWPPARRWGFEEFARRQGDFALAGIALYYDEDEQGRACNSRVGVVGVCSRPHRLAAVESTLNGRSVDENVISEAARTPADAVDPPQDLHADAEYRRALVTTLVERPLRAAAQRRSR
jgi:carbon-monoxide dehydrogenase medium subunit